MTTQLTHSAVRPAAVTTEERVGECLKRFGNAVMPIGNGHWRIDHEGNGQTHTVVVIDEAWLVVERALSDCRLAHDADVQEWSWRLLDATLERPSGARPVLAEQVYPSWPGAGDERARLTPANNLARMRAERFVAARPTDSRDDDLRRWIDSACADVAAGALPVAMVDNAHAGPGCGEAIHPGGLWNPGPHRQLALGRGRAPRRGTQRLGHLPHRPALAAFGRSSHGPRQRHRRRLDGPLPLTARHGARRFRG